MSDNTPRRGGKRAPKDVPHMTEEQKQALCNVRDADLYDDPRSLVQIWRDAGVSYHESEMPPPPPSGNRSHHRRTMTGGSHASSIASVGSARSGRSGSNSQALITTGSPPPRNRAYDGGYPSYPNGYVSGYANGHGNEFGGGGGGAMSFTSPPQQAPQQTLGPASRMGHPATAFFIPGDQDTAVNATRAANADAYRTNGNVDAMGNWGFGLDGSFSPPPRAAPAPANRAMPAPGTFGNDLEDIFRNGSGDEDQIRRGSGGGGHRRNNSRFGSNSSWGSSNGSNSNHGRQ